MKAIKHLSGERGLSVRAKFAALVLSAYVGLLLLGGGGLLALTRQQDRLQETLATQATAMRALIAVETAHTHFKIQVQEWKDILLRGNDAKAFDQYLQQFAKEEAQVQESLTRALGELVMLGIDPAEARALLAAHATLGEEYRAALAGYDRSDVLAGQKVDRQVKGKDRPASEGMNRVVGEIEAVAAEQAGSAVEESGNDYRDNRRLFAATLVAAVLLLIVFAALILRALFRQLGGELEYAARISRRIAAGDLEVRIDTRPDDKTSLLAAMKEMRDSLRATQAELVATARQAGMAEIATNVLHNVGNVLNSVNVSASLVNNQIRNSKAAGLHRAAQMIDAHAADLGDFFSHDEKGRRLPEYLRKLADALAAEQTSTLEELGRLARSVEHIMDIVAAQQSHAGTSRLVEPVHIRDLLDDALRINAETLTRHATRVIKDYAELPALPLDRHRVLQILVNLISNAGQAMAAPNGRPQRMTLRFGLVESTDSTDSTDSTGGAAGGGGVHRLQICVADEGDGISAENLQRIFSHGFTTRPNGHGFGLHSCIVAAHEMGGTLCAHSDGPGRGATFTLELPIKAAT